VSVEELREEVEIEFEYMETVLKELEVLNRKTIEAKLSLVEITASAGFLHNFYNGVENIFKRILKHAKQNQGMNQHWHKELLRKFFLKENEFAFLDRQLYDNLLEILKFRHVFVHGYGFHLQWELLKPLIKKTLLSFPKFKVLCRDKITQMELQKNSISNGAK